MDRVGGEVAVKEGEVVGGKGVADTHLVPAGETEGRGPEGEADMDRGGVPVGDPVPVVKGRVGLAVYTPLCVPELDTLPGPRVGEAELEGEEDTLPPPPREGEPLPVVVYVPPVAVTGGEGEGELEGVGGTGVGVSVPGMAVEVTVEEGRGEVVAGMEGVTGALGVTRGVSVPWPC